ncbi:MAG: hypothetical protein LJE64_03970, partial [Desulfofustis sp.]|nr:hypothetical protein [Desulfofustis sp.]
MGAAETGTSRRWIYITGVITAIVILFFALLPAIMSSQWGKERALGAAAPHIPGAVAVDRWSLSWFGGQNIAGIHYSDTEAGIEVDTAEVTVAKGLISLLLDRGDLGTVTVSRPVIQITAPGPAADDTTPGQPSETGRTAAGDAQSGQADTGTAPGSGPVPLPPIRGHLLIREGSVFLSHGHDIDPVATGINAEIDIPSLSDDIAYSLALSSPEGTGTASVDGTAVLQPADTIVGSLQLAGDVAIAQWDISQILDLAAQFTASPTGSGILDSNLSFNGSPADHIGIDGTIDLSDLELSGGPLGEDHPFLEKTSIVFSASTDLGSVKLSSLELSSPLAAGSLAATVAADGAVQFTTDLRVDLPAVAGQLPHTLNLQEDLQITDGVLAIEAEAHSAQGENQFSADALVESLAGIRDTTKISLAEPFAFKLKGRQGTSGLSLEHFSVQSSFLTGEGQGSLDDLRLSLQADLGKALSEISQFIALQDFQAAGLLALSVEARRKDDSTIGLTARLNTDRLTLKQSEAVIIPQTPLMLEVDSDLLVSREFVFGGAAAATLNYRSWLGQGSLSAHDIRFDADRGIQTIGELAADGQLTLKDLSIMLKSLDVLPETFDLNGGSHFRFKVSGENGRFLIDDLVVDFPKLIVKNGRNHLIPESTLKIRGRSEVMLGDDGGIAGLGQPALTYQSWLGSGNFQAAALDVSSRTVNGISFTGETDLSRLAAFLNSLELLPPDLSFSGMETTSLKLDYSPEQIDLLSLHQDIEQFVLEQQGKTYRDERLVIDAAGFIDMQKRQVSFKPVQIDSANGTIS